MNTESSKADVSEELRFFLDYVAGRKTETGYVRKLEDAVRDLKMPSEKQRRTVNGGMSI